MRGMIFIIFHLELWIPRTLNPLGGFALFRKTLLILQRTHFNNEDLPFLPNTSLWFIIA
jgi:hypothetical protein